MWVKPVDPETAAKEKEQMEKMNKRGGRGKKKDDADKDKDEQGGAVVTPVDGDESPEDATPARSVILEGINLTLERGKLYGVVGSVGSGKSSLLSAILGDMSPTEGTVVKIPHKR